MKRTIFSETQIVNILKEAEAGIPVTELSRKYGFSQSAFYKVNATGPFWVYCDTIWAT